MEIAWMGYPNVIGLTFWVKIFSTVSKYPHKTLEGKFVFKIDYLPLNLEIYM